MSLPSVKNPMPARSAHSRPIKRPGAESRSDGDPAMIVACRVSGGVTPAIGWFMVAVDISAANEQGAVKLCRVAETFDGFQGTPFNTRAEVGSLSAQKKTRRTVGSPMR